MARIHPPHRPSAAAIKQAAQDLGHDIDWSKPILVGLRRSDGVGEWNDLVGALGGGLDEFYLGTTDPGRAREGIARVMPGHHIDALGWHYHKSRNDHPCLGQRGDMPYQRWIDGRWQYRGSDIRGFNLHRARFEIGSVPTEVGGYSEGCAVIPDRGDHWALMEAMGCPEPRWSDEDKRLRFDYLLIDWQEYTGG